MELVVVSMLSMQISDLFAKPANKIMIRFNRRSLKYMREASELMSI